jgi:hypothetical protein
MKLTNRYGYPEAFVKMAERHLFQPKEGRIGVTALIKSPQIRRLTIDKWDNLVVDVDDLFTGILGSCFHKGLELNVGAEHKAEQKWEHNVDGIVVVGKADLSNGGIEDYKLLSAWSWVFGEDKDWIEQLNSLNWLRIKSGFDPAKFLKVHAFVKDWSAYQAKRDKDYPQTRYINYDVPIWAFDETEHFIRQRVSLHQNLKYTCSDADKWIKLEKWAVKHQGKDKADRLLDTAIEAEKYIMQRNWVNDYATGKITITQRKSQPKNCLDYCLCRSVCPFALGLK